MTGAIMSGAVVTGAVMTGAVMTGAMMTGAVVTGAVVTGAVAYRSIQTYSIANNAEGMRSIITLPTISVNNSACIFRARDVLSTSQNKVGTGKRDEENYCKKKTQHRRGFAKYERKTVNPHEKHTLVPRK